MEKITTIGLDTSKNVFHIIALNRAGQIVLRKQLRRSKVLPCFAQLPSARVGIEACGGSHHWAREISKLGHRVYLVPPRDVKALLRGQKNDYNDALAIAETLDRPQQRFVTIRTQADHDIQSLHRLRRGYISERTALSNRIRGLLTEYGIIMPRGLSTLRRRIPELLEDAHNQLSPVLRALLNRSLQHLHDLDSQIDYCDQQLRVYVHQDEQACRLMQIPGFGPVVASHWRARVCDGKQFRRGRDAAAACGLVPRQHTTGGRPLLLGISKKGERELRTLLVHGARSVINHAHKKDDALSQWACQVMARRGKNKATVALANKMARIAWAMSVHEQDYRPRKAA